jgi:hypothetical protein
MKRLALVALLAVALPAGAQNMDPGEWELSSTMTSPALPKPQSATVTHCLSKEDAENPSRFVSGPSTHNCTLKPGARAPDSFEWAISCPDQHMTGTGKLRYSRRSLDADLRMVVETQPGQKIDMQTRVSGRLLGPCKAK